MDPSDRAYEIGTADRLIRLAIADVAETVRKETALPVFFGSRP